MSRFSDLEARLAAEEALESAQERITELESRLRGVLGSDPTSATRALSWIGRAQNAEKLLIELERWMAENPSVRGLLPDGFASRLTAQLRSVLILRRDQEAFGESPPEEEWWEQLSEGMRVARE